MNGILSGIRVVDTTRWLPGRWATSLLADYGADVISVIDPGFTGLSGARGGSVEVDRNRRSIYLNLKVEGALDVFYKLVSTANAMLESYRPAVAYKLGIDYESVRRVNSSIVYCSLSGYGQDGPYRDLPGHDLNFQAISGSVPLDKQGRPRLPAYPLADKSAAVNGGMALLMGLLHQLRTGQGQYVDVAFSDGTIQLPPGGSRFGDLAGDNPGYNIYECKDGEYITIGTIDARFWERLCRTLGRPDFIEHQRPKGARRREIMSFFKETFKTKTQEEWFQLLWKADIEVAPLRRTTEQVAADPHNRARGIVMERPTEASATPQYDPGFALHFSETPGEVRWGPTEEGSHSREVLSELGYSEEDIVLMAESGITRL